MINIFYDTTQVITFYLTPSLTNPTYLISLVDYTARKRINFLSSELSSGSDLLQFSVTEVGVGSIDLLNGSISIKDFGRYTAELYEQSSATNLDQNFATLLGVDELIAHKEPVYDNPPERNPIEAASLCGLSVVVNTTNETSPGANDGTASAVVSGDDGVLSFEWTGPNGFTSALQNITGLEPGLYSVTVIDDIITPCNATNSGTVNEGVPLPVCNLVIISVENTPPTTLGGSDGTATVSFSGDSGNVAITWTGTTQTGTTATGLSAGKICVNVLDLDVNGCLRSGETTLAEGAVPDNVLSFNGVNNYTELDRKITATGDFTFQDEVYFDSFSSSHWVIASSTTGSSYVRKMNNDTVFTVRLGSIHVFTVPALLENTYYILHVTRISGFVRLYINGVESTTGAIAEATAVDWGRMGADRNASSAFYMGRMNCVGFIDGVGATSGQITTLAGDPSLFISTLGPLGIDDFFYDMNQSGTDPLAIDSGGFRNDALLTNYTFSPSPCIAK